MKKLLCVFLSLVTCASLFAGCNYTTPDDNPNSTTNESNTNSNTNDSNTNNNVNDSNTNNNTNDSSANNNTNDNNSVSNENIVLGMFLKYAQYDNDGNYRFRKYENLSNVSFSYCFTYSPSYKLYNASVLVTTNTNLKLYDYAAITFSWGNFKNGLFYGYHELDSIAKIEFEYKDLLFNSNNTLGETYSYKVTSNSFVNLNNKADIDEYAAMTYSCVQQAISYLNSVFFNHNLLIKLY